MYYLCPSIIFFFLKKTNKERVENSIAEFQSIETSACHIATVARAFVCYRQSNRHCCRYVVSFDTESDNVCTFRKPIDGVAAESSDKRHETRTTRVERQRTDIVGRRYRTAFDAIIGARCAKQRQPRHSARTSTSASSQRKTTHRSANNDATSLDLLFLIIVWTLWFLIYCSIWVFNYYLRCQIELIFLKHHLHHRHL